MRLSRFSDIGLRALLLLAVDPERILATAEMAMRLRVSRDHLGKSLQALQALGIVRSTRGRSGGFVMQSPASSVKVGSLVRQLEPSLALAECFESESACPLTGDCRLAGALSEAQDSFFRTLDQYTVQDLVAANYQQLVEIGGDRAVAHHGS